MQRFLNKELAEGYKSSSQIIRVLTEDWVDKEVFCPSCGSAVNRYKPNHPVADFYCPICSEKYELKSKGDKFGRKIVDGAFNTVIDRLKNKVIIPLCTVKQSRNCGKIESKKE